MFLLYICESSIDKPKLEMTLNIFHNQLTHAHWTTMHLFLNHATHDTHHTHTFYLHPKSTPATQLHHAHHLLRTNTNSKFTPDQCWQIPNQTYPIYDIKHAKGNSKKYLQAAFEKKHKKY